MIEPTIPYCQDVKVIYSTMSTGTDLYSIAVGMGLMMIIDFINDWMVKKGWIIDVRELLSRLAG